MSVLMEHNLKSTQLKKKKKISDNAAAYLSWQFLRG